MRKIKFRGETWHGEIVYGYYCCERDDDVTIHAIIDEQHGNYLQVKPDSVAQLVFVDKDGREVYEGDTVIDYYYDEYTACIKSVTCNEHENRILDCTANYQYDFKLKPEGEQCT